MSVMMIDIPREVTDWGRIACPEKVTFRPIPGLDGYFLGSDCSLWSMKHRGRPAKRTRGAPQWRLVPRDRSGRRCAFVWHGGKTRRVQLDSIFPLVFPELARINPELN